MADGDAVVGDAVGAFNGVMAVVVREEVEDDVWLEVIVDEEDEEAIRSSASSVALATAIHQQHTS